MKVSIALATYNGSEYVGAQLQSFIDQTRLPDELIVSDDCSTDQTVSIVRDFASTAPFKVEVLQNHNRLGYCGNFNAAIMQSTGDLVFLSDQDDVWFPEKIEYMVRSAELNRDALLVMNDAVLTDGQLNSTGLTKIGQIRSAGLGIENFVMGCCCVVRRELLDMCTPIPSKFKAHDGWLCWFADGLNVKRVEEEVLQYYRRHGANESRFIANRGTSITPLDALIDSVRKILFDPEFRRKGEDQAEQVSMFVAGIKDAKERAWPKYQDQLAGLLVLAEARLRTLSRRNDIRQRSLVGRLVGASSYYLQGGYSQGSGLKSALRDLIG